MHDTKSQTLPRATLVPHPVKCNRISDSAPRFSFNRITNRIYKPQVIYPVAGYRPSQRGNKK